MLNKLGAGVVAMIVLLWGGSAIAVEKGPRVLFDQGHDQRFLIEKEGELQLTKFAGVLRGQGLRVTSTKKPLSDATLKGVTALVISGPFESLRTDEVDAVVRFIERGGRVAAMLHIGPPLSGLLERFDLAHSNAILHERSNAIETDTNFRVTDLSDSPLFEGITQFSAYGVWALDPGKAGTSIARTSRESWVDLDGDKVQSKDDPVGAFSVVVSVNQGKGAFVVFGDDAIFQNRYLDENNGKLAANLGRWLAGR